MNAPDNSSVASVLPSQTNNAAQRAFDGQMVPTNSTARWYYAESERSVGPFDTEAMAKIVRAGLIDGNTQVTVDGGEQWQCLAESPLQHLLSLPHAAGRAVPTPSRETRSAFGNVQRFICAFSGLEPLVDFRLSFLFDEAFKRRSRSEVDDYFTCGGPRTTPALPDIRAEWPHPWFCWRMLGFGLLVLLAFCFAFAHYGNEKVLPGLIIVGAFFVPLACVAMLFEFNVPRNISLYQVTKFIVGGGIVSIVVALSLFAATGLDSVLGAMSAGIVEELAKVAAVVLFLRKSVQYRWILNGLLIGAAVGAGFAGFESAGYIFDALSQGGASGVGLQSFYFALAERAVIAPFCHVVWTSIVVGALWRVKEDQPLRPWMFIRGDFLRILVFVMLLHMLWNSGLLFALPRHPIFLKGQFYLLLVSFVGSWYLLLLVVQTGIRQIKSAQAASTSTTSADDWQSSWAQETATSGAG